MHDHRLLLRTLADLPSDLRGASDATEMLQRLADVATEVLDLAGAGVLIGAGDRLTFVTAVPEQVAALERHQERHQSGPCMTAYRTGRALAVPDLSESARRWDGYAAVAEAVGVRAVAGIPLRLAGRALGALDLYAGQVRRWDAGDLAAAQVLANIATAHYAAETDLREKERLAEQLQRALDSRVVIEQAKGVMAEAHGVPPDVAFERLRRWARGHNQPLRAVARRVVEEGLRP